MDKLSSTPAAANELLKTLRPVFKYAKERSLLPEDPSAKIRKLRYKHKSHHTWSQSERERFCLRHPEGSDARLAFDLFLFTGLRKCDVAELRPDQILEDEIRVLTKKTDVEVRLHIHDHLRAELARHDLLGPTILLTAYGTPFSVNGLGNKMKQWRREAGLPHCTSHGLRSAGATIAAENGAIVNELMSMYGWKNPATAMKYTTAADKKRLSRQASEKIVVDLPLGRPAITPTRPKQWEQNQELPTYVKNLITRLAHHGE
ncbi:tyrosine-type recombinase/integrase [Aestuariivirga sp.]|jgi:integrase|uniref:tyrosine-type recombinase/integrase n=1 Tax=Aestuariivirga sp. TaxID=2650926 RepID=UPI003783CEBD